MKVSAIASVAIAIASIAVFVRASTCEQVSQLHLPNTQIESAEVIPAGHLRLKPGPSLGDPEVLKNLPQFCRVLADIRPTRDSNIKIEVWLPISGWNGKFEGVGNGGWAGSIFYPMLGLALQQGYAAAATNTGHDGNMDDASFALGHPEKVIDFGYRAVHEMTSKAKAIIAVFYGKQAARAYWFGCSTGGKQGLTEAQKFPLDYDGIVAGAPANYWTHLMAGDVWTAQATLSDPAHYIPKEKYPLIHKATLDVCDAQDGIRDGVIDDPRRCQFDPGVLQCKKEEHTDCLTAPQVEAAKKIYAGAKNPRTHEQVFPGLEPGSEGDWEAFAGGPEPPIVASHFKYLVFKNPAWNFRTLNFDRDVALADKLDENVLNATDPNLSKFVSNGGKLLLYHGWSDGLIAPENTINYYTSVVSEIGRERAQGSIRLFMVPGMAHCEGGDGTDRFDAVAALDEWVDRHKAPEHIVAAHNKGPTVERSRPLCPFPEVAKYIGTGSTDDAANFVCRNAQ